jgi:hypothetical protein
MGVATYERSDLDLFSDEVMADAYPHFAQLRDRGAVVWLGTREAWAITRYDPIRAAFADRAAFSSGGAAFNDPMNQALAGTSLATDPPGSEQDHGRLRAALTENLSPRVLRGLRQGIDAKADALGAALVQRGSSTRWTISRGRFRPSAGHPRRWTAQRTQTPWLGQRAIRVHALCHRLRGRRPPLQAPPADHRAGVREHEAQPPDHPVPQTRQSRRADRMATDHRHPQPPEAAQPPARHRVNREQVHRRPRLTLKPTELQR